MGGINIGSLLLIFIIVLLLFGTKRLRGIGEDLGAALRSFRKGLQEDEKDPPKRLEDEKDKTS